MQHGDETDETHGHAQNHHRRDLQSRRLVRVKSQHASLRRSSRVPLRVGRRDASTHRTYARHDDRTDAAHRHRQSRVTVSHTLARDARPRPRRSLRAFIVPTRALDRDYDSFRFDARASSRALSRARSTPSRVGRAVARPHATRRTRHVRPRAVKCGTMDGWIGPQIHPHRRR